MRLSDSFRSLSAPLAALAVSLIALLPTAAVFANDTIPSLQMALGNPDHASAQVSNRAHYLIRRPQFAESYSDTLHFPNWVSWDLTKSDVGATERGQFKADTNLPPSFTAVTPSDYTRSGYDRGHNCPSKDRSDTRANNDSLFLMSNMTPQTHGLNAGPWELLEIYCRDLAGQGNELLITCGHGFSAKTHPTIGRAQVAVPDFGWKIVVVVPPGSGDPLKRINATTRVIAVRMPNINTVSKKDWREFRTSVQDIEQATGFTFFDALPKSVAAALKNRVDFDQSAPSKMRAAVPESATAAPHAQKSSATAAGGGSGQVWVNTRSKAYWKPGTTYYGKTKQGKYMSEADAIKAGYHDAGAK